MVVTGTGSLTLLTGKLFIVLNRREFLGTGALLIAGQCSVATPEEPVDTIIDTHTHFYDPTRPEGVPWPGKGDTLLYRQVLPKEYQELSRPLGITGTIVVEASPWLEDNQWVLDIAQKNPFVVGLVGNLSPGAPEFSQHLARFAKQSRFLGIRVNHSAIKTGLTQSAFLDDLRRLSDSSLELDINGGPDMLPDIARVAEKLPELRIVINHVANVRIDGLTPPDAWVNGIRTCAGFPLVYCKVSALVEGGRRQDNTAPKELEFYRPVLDTVWKHFGEDRLIYGSNWPVSARYASLADLQSIVTRFFQEKGRTAYEKFFWKNSIEAYRWLKKQ